MSHDADALSLDEYQKAIAPKPVEVGHRYFFVTKASGQRTGCYMYRAEAEANCDVSKGDRLEPRNCPYRGCTNDDKFQPPCPLCYE